MQVVLQINHQATILRSSSTQKWALPQQSTAAHDPEADLVQAHGSLRTSLHSMNAADPNSSKRRLHDHTKQITSSSSQREHENVRRTTRRYQNRVAYHNRVVVIFFLM
jgi:hypothetical protein